MNEVELAVILENALPQTQCTKCSYPNCRGYAEAMAKAEALPNQCPPGGSVVLRQRAVQAVVGT